MSKQAKKAQARSRRARAEAARRRWLIGGGLALVLVVALAFVWVNRSPAAEGFYRASTPGDVSELIAGGDPVLVYFHSPT